jgi:hypothetical protein
VPIRATNAPETNPFEPPNRSVGDFYSPFFTVRFLTGDVQQGGAVDAETGEEETIEITQTGTVIATNGNAVVEFRDDARTSQFRSYVTNLVITSEGNSVNTAELTLEPPLEDALKIIEERVVQFNSVMVIEWGWSSNEATGSLISTKHYFVLTHAPRLQLSGENATITLTGMDLFGYSSMKRETYREFRRTQASADNVVYDTDYKILEALVAKNKLRLNTTLAPIAIVTFTTGALGVRVPKVIPTGLPIYQVKPNESDKSLVVEQNEKDWLFFRRICEMNRLDFFTMGDTVYLVDQNVARVRDYAYRFVFWNQPRRSNDVPMHSFSTDALPTLFFPAESKELRTKHADEDAQQVVTHAYDPTQEADVEFVGERTAAGKSEADGRTLQISDDVQLIPVPSFASDETGRQMSVPSGSPNRDEWSKRVMRDSLYNQTATAEIPGVPGLVPMQLVRVAGVSKIFSGPYLVLKVVHKLSTNGYYCDVTLLREASTGDVEAGKGQRPVSGGTDPGPATTGEATTPVDGDAA